jgi:hypothetical protein
MKLGRWVEGKICQTGFFCDLILKLRSRRLPEEFFPLYPVLALSRPCFSETAEVI